MHLLSPLELESRYQEMRASRFDGVGAWILGTREWKEWNEGEGGTNKAILFCLGNPGVDNLHMRWVSYNSSKKSEHR